ncbi:16S rRNA (cytosine(1402)-N(4))-methyltransferase RsmH [Arcobacter sp. FWKO B]|uniref:16S rRNA (cytosine(1402)-N(4))-methyltransferase RsmH n=1 Tax=Arcobacter sp. FWKO B TaxID=2593672 RepID=UPI0018A63734|nr:16S rRNA (cytosine(1402)-N(4))-methyltransferase RsmH [Arcobacter sp. FWKO B]QOG11338.1 16S rRNA (cytosine(1402)-N(4))-methyltransferase RsmH [Arcobacter sp. FWKO B]
MQAPHIPVLLDEVIDAFKDIKDGYIIDCTLGYGGHSGALLKAKHNIKIIANDQDDEALEFSKNRLKEYEDRIIFNKGNFKDVFKKFKDLPIRGILADIGVSSLQLDKQSRGFGFDSDVLDMRMDTSEPFSASDVVNHYSQIELERIFRDYGEVKEYKKAASLVVKNRPFNSTKELSDMFMKNFYKGKIHPATLPFQAIRIEVNKELDVLSELFESIEQNKPTNTIVAIISFHSLEDRIVKNYFKKWSKNCICPPEAFRCTCGNNNAIGKVVTKQPITASNKELKINPRSRSAKLRIFKID